jgi:predicted sugar kinase
LEQLTNTQLIPASESNNFAIFSKALYRYGCLAGKCFEPVQGGIFSSPETARLIAWLRGQGIVGVGQSSWGPTVFALLPNTKTAQELRAVLLDQSEFSDYEFVVAAGANQGAIVAVSE